MASPETVICSADRNLRLGTLVVLVTESDWLMLRTRIPLILLATLTCASVRCEDAGVPYSSLYHALAPGLELDAYPRLSAVQRITSKRHDVAPATIKVWINAPEGRIEIPIAADGRVEFPLRKELNDGPTTVASNQPRGSLSVSLSFEVVPPRSTVWAWSEFSETLQQARAALAVLEGEQQGGDVAGLEFRMPTDSDSLTLETSSGEDLLLADSQRRIVLRWNAGLAAASTRIHFSRPPLQAFPYLQGARN